MDVYCRPSRRRLRQLPHVRSRGPDYRLPHNKNADLADQRVGELLPDHSHQVSVAAVSGDVRPTSTAFVETGSVTAANGGSEVHVPSIEFHEESAVSDVDAGTSSGRHVQPTPPSIVLREEGAVDGGHPERHVLSTAAAIEPCEEGAEEIPLEVVVSNGSSTDDEDVLMSHANELVLDCIPFSDLHSSSQKYEAPKKVREKLRSLCCDEKYSTNHTWITAWKSLLNPGQQNIRKEDMAVCLLEVMFENKSLSVQDQMSMLFEILSPSRQYNFPARCTLFAAGVYRMSLDVLKQEVNKGSYIMHYAAQRGYWTIIRLLRNWGLDVNCRARFTGSTPLLAAVSPDRQNLNHEVTMKVVEELLQCGAHVNDGNNEGDTPLLIAVREGDANVIKRLLEAEADRKKTDYDGNTILHLAARVNASKVWEVIMPECPSELVSTKNSDGKTPIHLAAMQGPECLKAFSQVCEIETFFMPDDNGLTPLDIAANAEQKATFKKMWDAMDQYTPAQVEAERTKLEFFIRRVEDDPSQWELLSDYLQAFPKLMLHKLLDDTNKRSNNESAMPTFRRLITASNKDIAQDYQQQREDAVRAVLDSSLFGERVIVTRTLDGADPTTKYKPATLCADCQCHDGSNLETILTTNLQIWDHQAVTLWLSQKLKSYGWIFILLYCFLYWVFLGIACGALHLAADLNATSDQLVGYSDDHDNHRKALEITAVILWLMFLMLDLLDFLRFGLYYLKWFGVYPRLAVNLCFLALLVTRLCGHSSQWVWASLFVICAALRAMEVFTVWKWSSVYLITLWIILRRELLKFLIIAVLSIFAFSMALRFAEQAERDETSRLQSNPAKQTRVCAPVERLLENGTNTTCATAPPLTQALASYLLGELESLRNLFSANLHSLASGTSELPYSTGDGLEGYELFTAVVYLAFLGLVVLLLVSVFIAQATASYNSVQAIADQMANYSSARLLTQTSSMLPMLLFSLIMKTCRKSQLNNCEAYIWSDWPLSDDKACCCGPLMQLFLYIWRVLQSILVTESSSLIKRTNNNQGNCQCEALKADIKELKEDLKILLDNQGSCQCEALNTDIKELKEGLKILVSHTSNSNSTQEVYNAHRRP